MLRSFLTLLLVITASPSASAQLAFELADPLVVIDGERQRVEGAPLRQRAFGALLVEAPGWGTLRISDAPFSGARRAGDFDGTRLVIVLGGRSLRLRSSTPLLNADAPVPAYVRLETDAGMPTSGPVRLGLAGTPDTAAPFRPIDAGDPREAPSRQLAPGDRQLVDDPTPERSDPPITEPPAEVEPDRPALQPTPGVTARLRAQIAVITAEQDGLRVALADAQREIANARRERDDARLRLGPLRAERDALRRDRDRLRGELARIQTAPPAPPNGELATSRLSLPDFDLARLDNPEAIRARLADTPYPEWAVASRLGGDVLVLFQTDTRGAVVRTAVPRPIGGGLDAIAEEIVRAMRFRPVRADGQATRLRSQVVVRFTP